MIADSILLPTSDNECNQFELFHEQLPLPVPCYDLLPVTEFTVTPVRMLQVLPAPLS